MNKKLMSAAVILCTVLSSAVMLFQGKISLSQGLSNTKLADKLTVSNNNEKKDESSSDKTLKNISLKSNSEEMAISFNTPDSTVSNTPSSTKESKKQADTTIFKMSKEEVLKELTEEDKRAIAKTASRLSAMDYNKIQTYLNSNDADKIKDAFFLLRDRLADNEYDEIRPIAEKFLKTERINSDNY